MWKDTINKKRSFESRPSRGDIQRDLEELVNMIEDSIYIVEKMLLSVFNSSSEQMQILKRAEFLAKQELEN